MNTNPNEICCNYTELLFQEACSLIGDDRLALKPNIVRTLEKTITKRGVVWLGQTCNLRCQFCYFIDRVEERTHPEHAFMSLEKASKICRTLVDYYGNNSIDIQGGEPTLYPHICDLVSYCKEIGLAPTLITNALLLDNMELCKKIQSAGVSDFLVSVQGLGEVHDTLVGCPGAHRRQMKALGNLRELGISFRFNVVMSKPALPQLPAIAKLAIKTGALVVNFITFNPFADQASVDKRSIISVPRYSEVCPYLTEALDLLDGAGVEVNVRYFPFCMVEERHRKSVYNFQQLSYDPHEWDFASWGWTGLQPQRTAGGEPSPPIPLTAERSLLRYKEQFKKLAANRFLRPILYRGYQLVTSGLSSIDSRDELYRKVAKLHAEIHCGYRYGRQCDLCTVRLICDGLHGDYADMFGTNEAQPLDRKVALNDPRHFLNKQIKRVIVS